MCPPKSTFMSTHNPSLHAALPISSPAAAAMLNKPAVPISRPPAASSPPPKPSKSPSAMPADSCVHLNKTSCQLCNPIPHHVSGNHPQQQPPCSTNQQCQSPALQQQ